MVDKPTATHEESNWRDTYSGDLPNGRGQTTGAKLPSKQAILAMMSLANRYFMATEYVHPDGFLGYVQGIGKEPKSSQPVMYDSKPDFEDYGLGCFLLAGSELYKLK